MLLHWQFLAHVKTWLRQKKVGRDEGRQNGVYEQVASAKRRFSLAAAENSVFTSTGGLPFRGSALAG